MTETFFAMGAVLCGGSGLLFLFSDTRESTLIRLAGTVIGVAMMWAVM